LDQKITSISVKLYGDLKGKPTIMLPSGLNASPNELYWDPNEEVYVVYESEFFKYTNLNVKNSQKHYQSFSRLKSPSNWRMESRFLHL
jgi:hypothetical protein